MRPWSKVQLIFWLAIAVLLPIALAPPFGQVQWPHDRLIVCLALFGILCAVLWRGWMQRKLRPHVKADPELRRQELRRALATTGARIAIDGPSGFLLLTTLVIADAIMIWLTIIKPEPMAIVGVLFFTVLLLGVAAQSIPRVGKPVLVLSREGVQPAGYPMLPWSSINGIEMADVRRRGFKYGDMLRFYVPDLAQRLGEAHVAIRALRSIVRGGKFARVVTVTLRNTSEPALAIERLSRDLWKAAKGTAPRWSIHYSEAEIQLAEKLEKFSRDRDESVTLESARRRMGGLHEFRELQDKANAAAQLRMGWAKVGLTAAVALMLLIAAWRIASLMTSFVATEEWFLASACIAAAIVLLGYALFFGHAKASVGDDLRGVRLWGLIAGMVVALVIVLPLAIWFVETIPGDIEARYYGRSETITVMATKRQSRRKGCDERLDGASLGSPICLSREEFARLPNEVPVTLFIRRGALGYHVDAHRIEAPRAADVQ